jgi:2-desacetyl-2-hydroxyethyl bacteriochlorophyllide A dehydrogenase
MKSIQVVMPEPYKCTVQEAELPAIKAGEALIKCESSAISAGTELAVYTGIHQWLNDPTRTWPRFPFVPGYSGVGRVLEVGPAVTRVKAGDRVIYGARHESHVVMNVEDAHAFVYPIKDSVPAQFASFLGLARFPFSALVQSATIIGQCVVVMGLGTIGQIATRLYAAAGAHPLIGLDMVQSRRALAEKVPGVAATLDPTDPQLKDKLRALNDGKLPDIVVDATGFPQTVKTAMNIVQDGGRVVMVGSPRGIAGDVDFYWDLHGRSITLIGAHGSAIGWEPRDKFPFVVPRAMRLLVNLLETERVKLNDIVTHVADAEEAKEMYDGLLNDKENFHAVAFKW